MHIAKCLIKNGIYQPLATRLKNGRVSPYIVRWPNNISDQLLEELGRMALSFEIFKKEQKFHIIGVANSGLKLANAVYKELHNAGKVVVFTAVDPRSLKEVDLISCSENETIIIDNAVTTGNTIKIVANFLKSYGIKVGYALRLFDREEVEPSGATIEEIIKAESSICLLSLLRVRDLISIVPRDEAEAIRNYLIDHGTKSIRLFLETNHVYKH